MKRGFLLKAQAKKSQAQQRDKNVEITNAEANGSSPVHDAPKAPLTHVIKPVKMSYGVVPEAGCLPDGLRVAQPEIRVVDPNRTDDYDADLLLMARIPNTKRVPKNDLDTDVSECLISAHVKRLIFNTPNFLTPLIRPTSGANTVHRIGTSPGKGIGMFATEDLEVGDLILAERPLFVAPVAIRSVQPASGQFTQEQRHQVAIANWEKTLEVSFGRMSEENRKAFMALHNAHTQDGSGPILGVVRTNGFELSSSLHDVVHNPETYEGHYTAIGKDISRINHSCSPNVYRSWDTASFAMCTRATRPIKSGEEIFIQYSALTTPASARQRELAPYGFTCVCAACSDPHTSDPRRRKIGALDPVKFPVHEAIKWRQKQFTDQVYFSKLENLVKLIEEEHLECEEIYQNLLLVLSASYRVKKDVKKAEGWKKRYVNFRCAEGYLPKLQDYERQLESQFALMSMF